MKYSFFKNRKSTTNTQKETEESKEDFQPTLSRSLEQNLDTIKKMYDNPPDLVIRELEIEAIGTTSALIYLDGMVDSEIINDKIVKHIQDFTGSVNSKNSSLQQILSKLISVAAIKQVHTLDKASLAILSGDTVFMLDGFESVLIISSRGYENRSIEEPVTEGTIRGSREGFIENIRVNTSMIRRDIRDPNLRIKGYKLGRRSKSDVAVVYVDGIVHPEIVKEVDRRLKAMDVDDVPESGIMEEFIEDSIFSPFPQIQNTERPDKVATALLQGRVAILLDGTPFALIVPAVFMHFLQSPDDYYERWLPGSLIRSLRYLTAFIAVFAPALYIALVSFHQGMLPSKLAFSIAATREGVPFPAVVEAFLMLVTMEILQEAGSRLPKPIGQTVGIVGGLVIGDAAVSAGIVSPIMVIVVAITAIATFTVPAYNFGMAFRIIRYAFMVLAATFGFFGIILAYICVNIHLVNLKSFGVPYTVPFSPSFYGDWKDLVFRLPHTTMRKRPVYTDPQDNKRMKGNMNE